MKRALLLTCAVLLGAQTALAQVGDYDRLIDAALTEFGSGRYEEALTLFEQAYAKKPSARAQRGMAKALFELRAYSRCVSTLETALANPLEPLTGSLRDDASALRDRAQHFVGRALVGVTPSGAQLLVDGRPATCQPPVGCALDLGPHTFHLAAADYQPTERVIEIRPRVTTEVRLQLAPVPKASAAVASPPSRAVPVGLAIGTTALAAAGVVASTLWLVDRSSATQRCNEAAAVGASCANSNAVAAQRDASMWALGGSAAGLAASVVVLVLVATHHSPERRVRATATGLRVVW